MDHPDERNKVRKKSMQNWWKKNKSVKKKEDIQVYISFSIYNFGIRRLNLIDI